MADLTVFPIPQAPSNYNKLGKKLMIHDLTQPEATSTRLINFENIIATPVTYTELTDLITNNNLIEGSYYLLMNFQTIYDQMDFDNDGSLKGTLTTKTGGVEEIWVLALAPDRIASTAYSKTFPNDKIQYDWTYNATLVNGSPAKGRISERIDEWNNRTDYDHRVIKFIRYDDGAGKFTVINDNGNASQEFLTFGNTYGTNTGEIIAGNYLGDYYVFSSFFGQEYPNNVFHATTLMFSNKLGLCYNNTWGDGNYHNTWGNSNYSNNWGDGNYHNTWGSYNYSNNWGNNNNSNTWGNDNNSNNWGDSNYSNTWDNQNNNNTWGDNNNSNTWGSYNYSNNWGDSNNSNNWDDNNYSNNWGDNNNSNNWDDGNYSNTWGNYNNSNNWGNDNNGNTWGNDNRYNNWGDNNQNNTWVNSNNYNTWGNVNNYNTWGNGNNYNTWGNYNSNNTWGNYSYFNTWGNDNGGNAFGNENSGNTFGNHNQSNTFTHSSPMNYLNIDSNLQGKTIDDVTYPIIFNTNFKKEIIQASNGNYYIKTFDGTTDQYILIP